MKQFHLRIADCAREPDFLKPSTPLLSWLHRSSWLRTLWLQKTVQHVEIANSKHLTSCRRLPFPTCVQHKHELWVWFTLSYAIMKALLRLAAVRDTKQAGELRSDTVHFIASSSALVLMTQNGNIYRPLTQTATCLLRLYNSKHIAENS